MTPSAPSSDEVSNLAAALGGLTDPAAQRARLAAALPLPAETRAALAQALKQQADRLVRADIQQARRVAELLRALGELANDPACTALGLRALGNVHALGLGEFAEGLACYDAAAAIYGRLGDELQEAQSQIGKIYALSNLGEYDAALAVGRWASEVFERHEAWPALAGLLTNVAILHGRISQDAAALAQLDRAAAICQRLGADAQPLLLTIRLNRAILLRNLGRFDDSIADLEAAWAGYRALGETESAARARQNLALTYFVLGRYNEALQLLDEARQVFLEDGRLRHAMLVELFVSNCLLQLRRFDEVLDKAPQIRALFAELGASFEVGQALLNEATAHMGLAQPEAALAALAEARAIFAAEGNAVAAADADLQQAAVWLQQGQCADGLALARRCAALFGEHDLPVGAARACLLAARAALACDQPAETRALVEQALQLGRAHQIPAIVQQAEALTGALAVQAGDLAGGLAAYERAIALLEQLYGRLMVEFRADYLADKSRIYEDAVALCLEMDRPADGLAFAERAKSRALQDMVALRLDMSLEARSPADLPLVARLRGLRAERDRLYRRWETDEEPGQRGETDDLQAAQQRVEQRVLQLEKEITGLWHQLLVRNADYARDAALWQVRAEPVQPYLDADTLLLEYFVAHEQVIVFLVTADDLTARRLPLTPAQAGQLLQLLWLNLRAVPRSQPAQRAALARNAQGVLQKLHAGLLAPLADVVRGYEKLIVVPHGRLHYLPFHALRDGDGYLVERHELSYLPGSSLLRHCRPAAAAAAEGLLAVGHSYQARLPHAVREARQIAGLWRGAALLEDAATLANLRAAAPRSRIVHLATHGDFRPDNPVFSGLALADGWLTTLDIFSLRLRASLVTLSACQTGRSVIGGGDELLGLMRAFLAAGAASLVATFWAVADDSTAALMDAFYRRLLAGAAKGAALRQAQLALLAQPETAHPYFWAPFYLVGDAGGL